MPPCRLPRWTAPLALATLSLCPGPAWAAHHPERRWFVQETPHFRVHAYPGVHETARRVAAAAEEAYPRLQRVFGAQPGPPIPIILDQDAFFNGEAEPLKDRITLDPVLAASSVVGTRRFVAHELAHVMTFRALQGGHALTRLNLLGTLPTWLLEGVAQLAAERWYPSLDRLLRLATLEDRLLTPGERAHFRQLGVHVGAAGYNEGYALCRELFGEPEQGRIAAFFAHLRSGRHTVAQAIALACGASLEAVEARWRAQARTHYTRQTAGLDDRPPQARRLAASEGGTVHVRPRLSPDGRRLAFLTSDGQDRFLYLRGQVQGLLSLAVAAPDGAGARRLPGGQGGVMLFDWSPDGRELAHTRLGRDGAGNPVVDAHVVDVASGRATRLTTDLHVVALAWRPGSPTIAVVTLQDGVNTLSTVDRHTRTLTPMLTLPAGWQWRDLAFSPDGRQLAAVAFQPGDGGRLVLLDWRTRSQAWLTAVPPRGGDSAPCWTPDGRALVYASDRDGMANLHMLDLLTGHQRRLTRTWRGAEGPSVSPDGHRLLFSTFLARGTELLEVPLGPGGAAGSDGPPPPVRPAADTEVPQAPLPPGAGLQTLAAGPGGPRVWSWTGLPSQPTADLPVGPVTSYRSELTQDLIMPSLTADERGQQLGLAAMFSDVLRQQELGLDVRWGLLSQRFAYTAAYTNRMGHASWTGRVFDTPQLGLAPDVGTAGRPLQESLYLQRLQGVSLGLRLALGGGRAVAAQAQAAHLGTLTPPVLAGTVREGALNTVSATLSEQLVRPTLDAELNPAEGHRLALGWTASPPALGSAFAFNQWLLQGERYFPLVAGWQHHLTWTFAAGGIEGEAPQPLLLGGPNGSGQVLALRGHAVGALRGSRLATTGLAYTLPLATHLDRSLGPLYLDRLYLSAFAEGGSTWGAPTPPEQLGSVGLELRLRATMAGSQPLAPRLGLAQALGRGLAPGLYVTF
ncbi:MAG: hypothetical protein VKS61_07310 [Candidatus Sericytochromatia bacterium]|nr:hypothetical protein [Candidatus Sericytochromatia bacterium]